jgi:O-antigen ligase/Tfp pilus assembly protein PilF
MSISLLRSETVIVSSRDYIIYLSYFIIYYLIINNIENIKQVDSFIKLFFIASSIIALYTIIQYYGLDPYLKELNALTSTIGQKNFVSNYLGLIFPLSFFYFLLQKTKKNKILFFALLSIIYTNLMICQSRGIWISLNSTVLIGFFFIYKFKLFKIFQENQKRLILLLISFLTITIIYSTDNPLNKSAITVPQRAISTFDEQDPSINARLLIWQTTFNMIKDKPMLGSGIGTFKMNYLNYQAKIIKDNPHYIKLSGNAREAHNEYLQMWAELGIVGLGLFLLMFYFFYKTVFIFLKRKLNIENKIIVLGLFMGITCFLIHSLFAFPLHVPALGASFFVIMSLTITYINNFNLSESEKEKNIRKKDLKILKLNINYVVVLILVIMLIAINFLVIKPYMAEIYYFKGMRYNINGNYSDALPNFEYADQLDPHNGRNLLALGTTYYNLNIQDKAEDILQKAKKYINNRNIFRNLGLSYMQTDDYKKAEIEFKRAIYLDPKFIKAYYDLGSLYFLQGDYEGTIEQWNKIIEIEPNFPNKYIILNNLGIVYNKKEMPDKALEYFLEALQLAPEGNPIIEEIEGEIYNIYKGNLSN